MSLGSVSDFQPAGDRAAQALGRHRQRDDEDRPGPAPTATRIVAPARLRAGSDGARRAAAKPIARPVASSTSAMTSTATPSSWPEVARSSIGTPSLVSVSWAKTQTATAMRADRADGEDRDAAQPQRHDREPERAADGDRQQRAARVGQQHGQQQDPHDGVGQRVDRRVARAARAQPQRRRHAERRSQADGVPVAERLAQPRVDLVGGQRAREDLGQDRTEADRDRRGAERAEQRAPPGADGARQGHGAREDQQVGERAVGLQPGVRRLDRPRDRQRGEPGEDREEADRDRRPTSDGR